MSSIPVGTVTFLFTDIEGSTRLWEGHPEVMKSSLARHDRLLHEAILQANGYVFKTVGDAFCAAFATAAEALRASLAAQIAIKSEPWPAETRIRVRMALHTGTVESRDSDYFGVPLNRVARLLSTGHGGQILVSMASAELVRDSLPPEAQLRSLGEHQLKDLGRPETIFQVTHPAMPDLFPPLRSLDNPDLKHNLPQQLTSFVGREQEFRELQGLLAENRLVTLTGSGGTGKTRLSLQVAADLVDQSPDGVWLVELALVSDPELVTSNVADVLGIKEQPGRPLIDTLLGVLKSKNPLLVLDNCEHLIEAVAKLADALLRNCPKIRIIATSRESLSISGERVYRVPSLSLPDLTKTHTAESLSVFEAVRLFVDRAVLSNPDFAVTNANAPALASLCHKLDGIPLAIELAAARARSLALEEIDKRLDQRFKLLTGGSRTALPRQQTLRALVDWSYDLLDVAGAAMLQRLSVFAGGWTLEMAEKVCTGDPIETWDVIDLLTELTDKSLLIVDLLGDKTRYRMLETVRHYASDRLLEAGCQDELRSRHLTYMRETLQVWKPELHGPRFGEALLQYDRELENIRAALEWATISGSADGLIMVTTLLRLWLVRAHLREGIAWVEGLLVASGPEAPKSDVASAMLTAAELLFRMGNLDRHRELVQLANELAEDSTDPSLRSWIEKSLAIVDVNIGEFDSARAHLDKAIEFAIASKDDLALARTHIARAVYLGIDERSVDTYMDALAVFEKHQDNHGIAVALGNLGSLHASQGKNRDAMEYHKRALDLRIRFNEPAAVAGSLANIAVAVAWLNPDVDRAGLASQVLGASSKVLDDTGFVISDPHERAAIQAAVNMLESLLGEERYTQEFQVGYQRPLTDSIQIAQRF